MEASRGDAPVAQLDRAPPSEGGGRTFESCRVRQFATIPNKAANTNAMTAIRLDKSRGEVNAGAGIRFALSGGMQAEQ
jgi:hypothetical protein